MAHPILEAQDALKTILDARSAWDNVAIRDGGPTEGEDITFDMFWFNDVTVPRDGWASLGAGRRRVTFVLSYTVAVRKYGDDERSARAQALVYLEDFMAAVKANPRLGNPTAIQQVDDVTGTVGSAPIAPNQWGAWFTGTLACTSTAY